LYTFAAGETKQDVTLGIDSGYLHIGLSAMTDKEELFSGSLMLRKDIVKLNSERSSYRRCRRSRKTWYRPVRFLNRKKADGWLAPSLQHKEKSHKRIIEKIEQIYNIHYDTFRRWFFMEYVEPIRDRKKIDDIKKILKATNLRNYCLFILGINSDLRICDLLNLKIKDVLDEKRKIKDRITIREQKTGKVKNFPIAIQQKKH